MRSRDQKSAQMRKKMRTGRTMGQGEIGGALGVECDRTQRIQTGGCQCSKLRPQNFTHLTGSGTSVGGSRGEPPSEAVVAANQPYLILLTASAW